MKKIGDVIDCFMLDSKEEISCEVIESLPIGNYFASQSGNLFQIKKNGLFTSMSPVTKNVDKIVDSLGIKNEIAPFYDVSCVYMLTHEYEETSINRDDFLYCMKYFREIYETHGTEAAVLLYFNSEKLDWQILYVLQCGASGGRVDYIYPNSELPDSIRDDVDAQRMAIQINQQHDQLVSDGYVRAGTIHSHCNFAAFHSSTDDKDEESFDGLHITIGNVKSGWSYSSRFMVNGYEFKIEDEQIAKILGIESLDELAGLVESDTQQVLDEHMSLLFTRPARHGLTVKSSRHGKTTYLVQNNEWGFSEENQNNYWWNQDGEDNSHNYTGIYGSSSTTNNYSLDSTYKFNDAIECIDESDSVRIFDKERKTYIRVTVFYYSQNRHKFPNNRFKVMDRAVTNKKAKPQKKTKEMFLINSSPPFGVEEDKIVGNYAVAGLSRKCRDKKGKRKNGRR